MSRPGFSELQKSMCKFVPHFIRRCVRDDPYLFVLAKIGAGKYRTSRRLRPFSVHFQTKADMAWNLKESFICQIEEYARNEVRLTYDYLIIQLFCFTSISRGKLRRYPVSC